jgi:ribosomal protein L37AE/L43A
MILCCPECQSTEVYEVAGGCVGQVYRCKKCGYRGSFVLEIDEEELKTLEGEQPNNVRDGTIT